MKQKKILVLAGTHFQIPVIEYAKSLGHYVITCDNRPWNVGHRHSHHYLNISTTDHNAILDAARTLCIDAIIVYGTDPAAPTAAFVSEAMGLPGNPLISVNRLSNKRLFRQFLAENSFNFPDFKTFNSLIEAQKYADQQIGRLLIKPVDSSGSKGVYFCNPGEHIDQKFESAISYSRSQEVIIESYIERKGPHLHGEAFVSQGKIVFLLLGDQYFSDVNPCAPISTTLPGMEHQEFMDIVGSELNRLIGLLGYKSGGLNIEIIRDDNDRVFFIEVGARNGGNLMPELAELATGFNLAAANVIAALGDPVDLPYQIQKDKYCTQVILHSRLAGKLKGENIPAVFNGSLKKKLLYYELGDLINPYHNSQDVIGVNLYSFNEKDTCKSLIDFVLNHDLIQLT